MTEQELQTARKIFSAHPEVKLAYLFGSQATNQTGPLSDYDFAIYLDEHTSSRVFNVKAQLLDELGRALKTDAIDIVVIDTAIGSELKYNIISSGILLHYQEPYRVLIEPRILNEYFDFKQVIGKHYHVF